MTAGQLALRRVRLEQHIFWRHREAAFFSFLMPIVLLVILGALDHSNTIHVTHQAYDQGLVPGILVFGLMATCFVNLATTVVKLRETGVLKRLRATPLPPRAFLAGQLGSTLVVCTALTVIVVVAGQALFGVHLTFAAVPAFVLAVLLGSICFAAVALALTAAVSTFEAAGPVTNAVYLPLTIISSAFSPAQFYAHGWVQQVAGVFPVQRFARAVQQPFLLPHSPFAIVDLAVLAAWAVVGALVALRWFRWTPSR